MALTETNVPKRQHNGFGSPRPFRAKPRPPGYVTGRPTLYRPEYCESVVKLMGEGYDLTAFAGSIGVGRETVYDWMGRFDDFRHAVNAGKAARSLALQTKLLTTKVGVGVTAAIFALKNAEPDDWRDIYHTESKVTVGVRQISDAELLAIAANGAREVPAIEHERSELPQADERQPVAKGE